MTEITDYINNDIKAIAIDESIETVQDFFAELSFSHFPVLEDGTLKLLILIKKYLITVTLWKDFMPGRI